MTDTEYLESAEAQAKLDHILTTTRQMHADLEAMHAEMKATIAEITEQLRAGSVLRVRAVVPERQREGRTNSRTLAHDLRQQANEMEAAIAERRATTEKTAARWRRADTISKAAIVTAAAAFAGWWCWTLLGWLGL